MLQIVRQLFSTAGYSVQLFKLLLHIALGSQLCLSHFAVLAESAHHSHSSGCVEMSNSVGTFSVRSNRRVRAAMNVQPSSDIDPYNDPSQMAEVDLLVLYTGDVLDSYGQTIRSEIERAVAYAQAAMQRSGVNVLLNVVHQSSISNPPAGQQFVKQLRMLTGRSDNQWDEVHSLRETHAADLVLLYSLSGFECGRAHLFEGDRTKAFGIINPRCRVSTTAHELGHMFGSMHDRENSDQAAVKAYGYGWRGIDNTGTERRTIMSYTPGEPIDYFATPHIQVNGTIIGDESRNNVVKIFNHTKKLVADFMPLPRVDTELSINRKRASLTVNSTRNSGAPLEEMFGVYWKPLSGRGEYRLKQAKALVTGEASFKLRKPGTYTLRSLDGSIEAGEFTFRGKGRKARGRRAHSRK